MRAKEYLLNFAEDDMVELTPELRELFDRWTALTDEQKAAIWQIIKPTNNENTNKGFGPYFFTFISQIMGIVYHHIIHHCAIIYKRRLQKSS